MTADPEALFRGHIYRVTGEPVVANVESNVGTARELHLARCRTLRGYPPDGPGLIRLSAVEVDEAWVRAVAEDTTTETLATDWPFSTETGWCPHCIVEVLPRNADGTYRHPLARSAKWRPGIPLGCRFPNVHDEHRLCGCPPDQP